MKKLKLTKVIASSLIVASVLALNPIGASASWKQDGNGWWYTESDSYSTGWKTIDGKWYYFNSDGYMAHDTTIDGYKLASDGAWVQETVLATIGDEKITKGDLDKVMSKYDAQVKQKYGDNYAANNKVKDQITKIKKQQLNNLVIQKILLKKATELNIKPSENDLNKQTNEEIKKYKAQYSDEGKFKNALQQNGITENEFKETVRDGIIIGAVQNYIVKDVKITDDDVQKYYNQNKDKQYAVGAGATVAHILVADEATAKSLKAKLNAGADFATLAKENSIDPGSKDKGGSLGFVAYNSTELIKEFVDGFKNLKEGEVSQPVKSQFGYHLIKATGLKNGQVASLDQVKDEIKSTLLQQKQLEVFNAKIKEWKTGLKVKTYEDTL